MSNLTITVHTQLIAGAEQHSVNARDLHQFLEVGSKFADWITRRIGEYSFVENQDYILTVLKIGKRSNVSQNEYFLTLDMAKELAMVERTEKGKQARQYFIECEKRLRMAIQPESATATCEDNPLTILEFKGKPLRVLQQEGIRWWVLPDVEAATDTQLSNALKRLTSDDLRVTSIPSKSMDAYNRISHYTTQQHVVTDHGLKQLLGSYVNAGVSAFLTWGKEQWLTRPDHRVGSQANYDPNEFYLIHKSSLDSGACICTPNKYGTLTTSPIPPEAIVLLKAARSFIDGVKQEGYMLIKPEDVLKKLAL